VGVLVPPSTTIISTGAFRDSSLSPSSCTLVKIDGRCVALADALIPPPFHRKFQRKLYAPRGRSDRERDGRTSTSVQDKLRHTGSKEPAPAVGGEIDAADRVAFDFSSSGFP